MGTFSNPSRDSSTVTNPPLSSASRVWNDMNETWNLTPGTWDNPFASIANPSKNSSTIANPTVN